MTPRFFIGTSGWAYTTWKPGFYPEGTSAKKFLTFYASRLNSVEVNHTFGSTLQPGQLQGWLDQTAEGFRFSFKAPQRITHFNRLQNSHEAVGEFFDSLKPAAKAEKRGLVLFQLPPNFKADPARLKAFLDAPAFRRKSAPKIAFEFRHTSWFNEETYGLLRKRGAALCAAETDDLLTPEVHTAPGYACFRLRLAGGYKPQQIAAFAERMRALSESRDVYVYFRHEDEPTGALNATALRRKVGQ